MITDRYLRTSRVVRGLRHGPFGRHIDLYIEQLKRGGCSLATSQHYLSLARDFGFWINATGAAAVDINEALVAQNLVERSRHRARYRGELRR